MSARRNGFWLWWWELPGSHWWFPETVLGHEMIWSVNAPGPAAWPGMIRCLLRPHADDSYGNCCYCGADLKPGRLTP
jgi:hypothetical protein